MSLPLELDVGGEGEALALAGLVLTTVLPRAFAPGAPVRLTARVDGEAVPLNGKTIGSKRRDDGRFDVRMRLINLRKEQREALEARLSG